MHLRSFALNGITVALALLPGSLASIDHIFDINVGFLAEGSVKRSNLDAPKAFNGTVVVRDGGPCGTTPDGVPQYVLDNCCDALDGVTLDVNGDGSSSVSVDGLPYDCISAASWYDGVDNDDDESTPYACGDACLEWDNLSSDEYSNVQSMFYSHGG